MWNICHQKDFGKIHGKNFKRPTKRARQKKWQPNWRRSQWQFESKHQQQQILFKYHLQSSMLLSSKCNSFSLIPSLCSFPSLFLYLTVAFFSIQMSSWYICNCYYCNWKTFFAIVFIPDTANIVPCGLCFSVLTITFAGQFIQALHKLACLLASWGI